MASPFAMVLVGKFSTARPNMEFLRKGFQIIGFKGDVSLGLLDSYHILIRFALHEDYYRCWMRGSWSFKKHVMKVLKWTPDFTSDHEPPVAPIWVSFNHLPIHLFQQGPLLSVASLIGRPLKIDAAIRSLARPSVARVCIEVNLLHPLPKRIWIGQGASGFWQPIAYEKLPSYCSLCSRIGHADSDCSSESSRAQNIPLQQIWRPKIHAATVPDPTTIGAPHPNSSGLSGPEKSTIVVDIPPSQHDAAPVRDSNLPTLDAPQLVLPSGSSPVVVLPSDPIPAPEVPPVSVLLAADAPCLPAVQPARPAVPTLPLLNPIFDSADEVDEEIAVDSAPHSPVHHPTALSSPLVRSTSLPTRASSDPFPQVHDPEDADVGPWITIRKRKPYQWRFFGQCHMVTRSKSASEPVSND